MKSLSEQDRDYPKELQHFMITESELARMTFAEKQKG
jgi:hypothetical protein